MKHRFLTILLSASAYAISPAGKAPALEDCLKPVVVLTGHDQTIPNPNVANDISFKTEDGAKIASVAVSPITPKEITEKRRQGSLFEKMGTMPGTYQDVRSAAVAAGNKVHVINAENGNERFVIDVGETVKHVAYAPNGQSILVVSGQNARLYNPRTGELFGHLTVGTEKVTHRSEILGAEYSRDSRYVITHSMGKGTAILWPTSTAPELGQKVMLVHGVPVTATEHVGKLGALTGAQDGSIIFHHRTGGIWKPKPIKTPHSARISAIASSSDGSKAVSVSIDGTGHLFRLPEKGPSVLIDARPFGAITKAEFIENDEYVLTTHQDGKVRKWHAALPGTGASAELVGTYGSHSGAIMDLQIIKPSEISSPDTRFITVGDDGKIQMGVVK